MRPQGYDLHVGLDRAMQPLATLVAGLLAPACTELATDGTATETLSDSEIGSTSAPQETTLADPSCDGYINAEPTEPREIELRNVGDSPLFFYDPCFDHAYLQITNSAGHTAPLPICTATCDLAASGNCGVCDGCAGPVFVSLNPGLSVTFRWDGLVYEEQALPAPCQTESCGETCPQARQAAHEEVELRVEVTNYADCRAQATEPTDCDCDDDLPEDSTGCLVNSNDPIPSFVVTQMLEPGTQGPIIIELSG